MTVHIGMLAASMRSRISAEPTLGGYVERSQALLEKIHEAMGSALWKSLRPNDHEGTCVRSLPEKPPSRRNVVRTGQMRPGRPD